MREIDRAVGKRTIHPPNKLRNLDQDYFDLMRRGIGEMNMKRRFVLSLCAVALTAFGISAVQADVDVALNLRYTDPADPGEGGTWTLVAKTDSPGIAALVVRFVGGTMPAAGTISNAATIGHDINGGALVIGSFNHDADPNTPNQTEFVYGQDPNDGLVLGVGAGVNLWNGGQDPLDGQNVGPGTWDGSTIIATGSIANLSTRPSIFSVGANEIIGGDPNGPATIGAMTVRGDSLETLGLEDPLGVPNAGLLAGDANRDGIVEGGDFSLLGGSWQGAGGWDDGDFNDDDFVEGADFSLLGGNWQSDGVPPAIGAVPEPTTLMLSGTLLLGLLGVRRRK